MNRDSTPTLLARCDLHVDGESQALICRRCRLNPKTTIKLEAVEPHTIAIIAMFF